MQVFIASNIKNTLSYLSADTVEPTKTEAAQSDSKVASKTDEPENMEQ